MAGFDQGLVTGVPTLTASPSVGSGVGPVPFGAPSSLQPHHSTIAIVLAAVALLIVLDRAGFRFAVTAGRS